MAKAKKKSKTEESLTLELEGNLDLQRMLQNDENKYLMVNLLARRSRDINDGSKPLLKLAHPFTPLNISIAEGMQGLLKIERKEKQRIVVDLVEAS